MNPLSCGVVFAVVLLCCCATPQKERDQKFTGSLSTALSSKRDTAARLHVVGIATRPLDAQMESEVRAAGLEMSLVNEHLLRATGTPAQVRAFASFEWIEKIDLDPEHKFDPSLKLKISQLRRAESKERISVIGKCAKPISADFRKELEATGANIGSAIGDIFTAEVSVRELYALAALDAVSFFQLAQNNVR